jgi:integrase
MNNEEQDLIGNRVRIYRRGAKGTYCADFCHDGRHCRVSLKTRNRKVAADRAVDLAHSLQGGTFQRTSPEASLASARDLYLAYLATEGRAKRTLTRYAGELRLFLEFCERHRVKRLSGVVPAIIDAYRADRRQTRLLATVNHETMVIKQFCRWCHSRALIKANPLASYRVAKAVPKKRPAPTLQEVQTVLAKSPPWLRRILATLAFSGMRIGELQHLLVEDVDLRSNWIRVESREGAETKTRQSRNVPIHPSLRSFLVRSGREARAWYFTAASSTKFPQGDHWISPKKINEAFQRLAAQLGLPVGRKGNGYTIHSLRHFFETFTVNSRIPQRVVDTWMGHQSDRSMGAVYYTLTDTDSQNFMNEVPFSLGTDASDAAHQN